MWLLVSQFSNSAKRQMNPQPPPSSFRRQHQFIFALLQWQVDRSFPD
jgi:hypothetical protein